MQDLNYYSTVIAVADDCPLAESEVPPRRGGKRTVAELQYEMLAGHPFEHRQEDVPFQVWLRRQDRPGGSESEIAALREEFLSKDQPCLRSSPLAKRYGWGFVFDESGRVALLPMESANYREALANPNLRVLKALRSSRA